MRPARDPSSPVAPGEAARIRGRLQWLVCRRRSILFSASESDAGVESRRICTSPRAPHTDIIIRSGLAGQSRQRYYGANDLQRRRDSPPNRTKPSRAESSCRAREADDPWARHSTLVRRPRTIPTDDNVLSLLKSGEAPSQLRDLLPDDIFDEFPFLDAQYH
jgi:hypothetical protein